MDKCKTPYYAMEGKHYTCKSECNGFEGFDMSLDSVAQRCVQDCAEFAGLPYLENKTCVSRCGTGVYNDTTKICLPDADSCTLYRIVDNQTACVQKCNADEKIVGSRCTDMCPAD